MNATAPATAFVANMSDWEDDTDITDRPSDLDREWQQRREQHINSGYREGRDQGKDKVLQQGFDSGFSLGCQTGYAWGLLQGTVATLNVPALRVHITKHEEERVQGLAQKLDLPHDQVMLTQCDAMLHKSSPKEGRTSEEPSVISNARPSAKDLQTLMQSVQSALQELGCAPKARSDMQASDT